MFLSYDLKWKNHETWRTTQIELKLYDEHEKVGAIRKFCLIISSFEISFSETNLYL